MTAQFFTSVDYSPIYVLGSNEISVLDSSGNNVQFDCNQCTSSVCCSAMTGTFNNNCFSCACQNKGVTKCNTASICNGICNTTTGCSCAGRDANSTIYLGRRVIDNVNCTQALQLVADPSQRIYNIPQINAACDAQKRLLCCKGDPSLTQTECGSYWGPTNGGACDDIMTNYCQVNPGDDLCDCLTSPIPVPQCNDVRCANTTAMRLSKMMQPCNGLTINCTQIFELGPGAQNNIVSNVLQQLNCNTTSNGQIIGQSTSPIGAGVIIGIIVVVDIILCAIIIVIILFYKKPTKPFNFAKPKVTIKKRIN
jgi:hypothetical protein